ncbi:MAG: ABA4-like family protein [Candidatus Kapabacteria bacterium]|nr:ABA4-like family protein [Candidatus Kapabacteria bacterium]
MSYDALFQAANGFAMLGWLLLVFLPRWQYTRRVVIFGTIFVLAALYAVLFIGNFWTVNSGDGLMTLAGIGAAFQNPVVALIGWVHYLAFDMFVGAWEVHDAQTNGLRHFLVVPCLIGTFMAGPVGLLLYLVIRTIQTRRISV